MILTEKILNINNLNNIDDYNISFNTNIEELLTNIKENISNKIAYGELLVDQYGFISTDRFPIISEVNMDLSLTNSCFTIQNIWVDEQTNDLMVTIELLDNYAGNNAKHYIENAILFELKLRSTYELDQNNISINNIYTIDIYFNLPSFFTNTENYNITGNMNYRRTFTIPTNGLSVENVQEVISQFRGYQEEIIFDDNSGEISLLREAQSMNNHEYWMPTRFTTSNDGIPLEFIAPTNVGKKKKSLNKLFSPIKNMIERYKK